ncbi:arabinose transporter [Massilia pseudoviolaceinigra]|uniref:arabinose transporter n=1 Tax=Massilia pseudoviolaceinigra TaxID=3057165 RepID=UPI002796B4FA|nr:arabinose transporter [Massilia sp. CCM 9206]MDQ1923083.1 arabinose transporter [Massilia sp. CCM 9206]
MQLQPYAAAAPRSLFVEFFPISLTVFVAFLTLGLALPVLPLHVQSALSMSPVVIGIVLGSQFVAALLTRAWAGNAVDTRGAKRAVLLGLGLGACSGAACLASLGAPAGYGAVAILIGARVLLGCAESLVVTGALGWGVGLAGPQHAGKVMAWVGIAMYGAYAAGAPLGVFVYGRYGFAGIALASVAIPLVALAIVAPVRALAPSHTVRVPFYKVLRAVWLPGLGLALSSMGFSVITAFVALLFGARGWGDAALAFTAFGAAFIGARLLFGHLPDTLGGANVALVCVLIEAAGQVLMWSAPSALLACAGAAITGFGYSLAFPGFGVEAVRRAPPQSRAAAMGAYVAFLDMSLAVSGPLAGLVAMRWEVGSVYLAGAVAVASSAFVALRLLATRPA